MSRRITIAACQGIWTTNPDLNIKKIETFIDGISRVWGNTVKLLSFCEWAVTGFDFTRIDELAEPIPGTLTNKLCEIASKYKYYVCSGSMVEKDGANYYNTSLLISPKGEIILKYRKTHPVSPGVEAGITPGREFPVQDVPGIGKVGIMTCYDGFFPEVPRILAWKGAELILWPTMTEHPLLHIQRALSVTRAFENQCYLMAILGAGIHLGLGLLGHSTIVNPDGLILSEAGEGETILVDTIDLDEVTTARQEGSKAFLPMFKHQKYYGHKYELYTDFGKGAIFKQIKEPDKF